MQRSPRLADMCRRGAVCLMSTAQGQEAAAATSQSSGLRKFLLALVPIGVIAAVFERARREGEAGAPPAAAAAASPGAGEQAHATIHGGTTSHGVEIDPSNPLHKMLPETDCEFCLETREKLWGMVRQMRHAQPAGGGAGGGGGGSSAAKAPASGGGAVAAAAAGAVEAAAPRPSQ